MRNTGFTIYEMLVAVMFLMFGCYAYMTYTQTDFRNTQAKQLTAQTLYYAKVYSHFLSDVQNHKIYVMTGHTNECELYDPFKFDSVATFSLADLNQNYGKKIYEANPLPLSNPNCTPIGNTYLPSMIRQTNIYHQTPCIGVLKNRANKLMPLMFYVDTTGSIQSEEAISRLAAIRLGGMGGYFKQNGLLVGMGNWGLIATDPRVADAAHCGGARISPTSVMVNLDQMVEYNDSLSNDVALDRESDTEHQPGDVANRNTSKSDIYMQGNGVNHQIILDKQNNITMTTQGNTLSINSPVKASTFQATAQKASGSQCDADQVGAEARQADPGAVAMGLQQSKVVCADSQLICSMYGYRYCWLPVRGTTITYSDPNLTGKYGDKLICPAYAPFLLSATAALPGGEFKVYDDSSTTTNYCHVQAATWDGDSACANTRVSYRYPRYVTGPATRTTPGNIAASIQFLSSTVQTAQGSFSLQRGAQAVTTGSVTSQDCDSLCGSISYSQVLQHLSFSSWSGSPTGSYTDAHTGLPMCLCYGFIPNPQYPKIKTMVFASISKSTSSTAIIESAICTSKLILNAQ